MSIRTERAEPEHGRLDDDVVALVKGMLARGDRQSDIAACFLINSGRIAEINTGARSPNVKAAPLDALPPAGPYTSPFDMWKSKQELWRSRLALEEVEAAIQRGIAAVRKAAEACS